MSRSQIKNKVEVVQDVQAQEVTEVSEPVTLELDVANYVKTKGAGVIEDEGGVTIVGFGGSSVWVPYTASQADVDRAMTRFGIL